MSVVGDLFRIAFFPQRGYTGGGKTQVRLLFSSRLPVSLGDDEQNKVERK